MPEVFVDDLEDEGFEDETVAAEDRDALREEDAVRVDEALELLRLGVAETYSPGRSIEGLATESSGSQLPCP